MSGQMLDEDGARGLDSHHEIMDTHVEKADFEPMNSALTRGHEEHVRRWDCVIRKFQRLGFRLGTHAQRHNRWSLIMRHVKQADHCALSCCWV